MHDPINRQLANNQTSRNGPNPLRDSGALVLSNHPGIAGGFESYQPTSHQNGTGRTRLPVESDPFMIPQLASETVATRPVALTNTLLP